MGSDTPAPLPGLDDPSVLIDAIETAIRTALGPVVGRVRALETATGEIALLRERFAVLETREPVPGPPGAPGPAGSDGLGFEDASVEYDGERTISITWARGDARAERTLRIPVMLYRGVYAAGKQYERGDVVTFGGSLWHAHAETDTRPGDGGAWVLAVKRGRDGAR